MLPTVVRTALSRLNNAGFAAYAVGGCVRNIVMNLPPKDWDIATSARPGETARLFSDCRVVETGVKHGTVTVIIDDVPLEITTFRIEGAYSDNRHPDSVTFTQNLNEDLARRDFTVNAMALSLDERVIDPFGGRADIEKRIIRCVGNPDARFNEDALRIMRAMRFASELEFEVEGETAAAMLKFAQLLKNISAERIQSELSRLLCGGGVESVLRRFSPVMCVIIPEIKKMIGFSQNNPHHRYDVYEHTIRAVSAAPPEVVLRLTMLLHDIGKPHTYSVGRDNIGHFYGHAKVSARMAREILRRLKFSNEIIGRVETLVFRHDLRILPEEKYVLRWLSRLGEEVFLDLLEVKRADAAAKGVEDFEREKHLKRLSELYDIVVGGGKCFSLKTLSVNGDDLKKLGIPEGKKIGETLDYLLNEVIEGRLPNSRDALLHAARKKAAKK